VNEDQTFRVALIIGSALVLPVMAYFRIRSQTTGEPLDRRKEGKFIYYTLRPLAIAPFGGLVAFMINPSWMEWSSFPLPTTVRWAGIGISVLAGLLILWTLRNLGRNLTDTVVTRRAHTLVSRGPYRWIRHPFYVFVTLALIGTAVASANWFHLFAALCMFAMFWERTATEEAKLVERFGDQYRRYAARTGRFLPRRHAGSE
jgi:protein-S-isoprenylcysteine O-methyltransferase Ste14